MMYLVLQITPDITFYILTRIKSVLIIFIIYFQIRHGSRNFIVGAQSVMNSDVPKLKGVGGPLGRAGPCGRNFLITS